MTDPILKQMIERARERQEIWETVLVKNLPDPFRLKEITLMGSHSFTLLNSKKRMIIKSQAMELNQDIKETPAATARDYLMTKFKRGPKITHKQGDALRKNLVGMPNYAKPGTFTHGYYIDVKSAYWSIMNAVGWNVDYKPGEWLSPGTPPADFPFPDHKISRNCLVSVAIPGTIQRYTPAGYFDEIAPGNPLANLSLYRLISDVLNSIGKQAIKEGAIYVNTDGYIAPDERTAAHIIKLIGDWGLIARIKSEGPGGVKSSGAYAVGDDVSIPYKLRRGNQFINNIHAPKYINWLQDELSFWSKEEI